MTTNNSAHGFWDWLRLKTEHSGRKPSASTESSLINVKPRKQKPGRRIVFLEMP
jgi:hypothetical protein